MQAFAPADCARADWAREGVWTIFVTCDDLQTEWYVVKRYMKDDLDKIKNLSKHKTKDAAFKAARRR